MLKILEQSEKLNQIVFAQFWGGKDSIMDSSIRFHFKCLQFQLSMQHFARIIIIARVTYQWSQQSPTVGGFEELPCFVVTGNFLES